MHRLSGESAGEIRMHCPVHRRERGRAPSKPCKHLPLGGHRCPRSTREVLLDGGIHEVLHEILGRLTLLSHLEHQRQEVIGVVGERHVQLDAANEHKLAAAELGVHDLEGPVLDHLVRHIGSGGHRVLRLRDGFGVRNKLLLDLVHLHIILSVLGRSTIKAAQASVVRSDDSTACRGVPALPFTEVLAHLALLRDADVRPEDYDDVAVVRHVARERHEARLADERCSTDATHRKDFAPISPHQCGNIIGAIVDLVRAEGRTEQCVGRGEAELLLQDGPAPQVHGRPRERTREELLQALEAFGLGFGPLAEPTEDAILGRLLLVPNTIEGIGDPGHPVALHNIPQAHEIILCSQSWNLNLFILHLTLRGLRLDVGVDGRHQHATVLTCLATLRLAASARTSPDRHRHASTDCGSDRH
mmetsp:Transcript_134729/g.349057  ORF Transcript_134729/g.349057 Transcript_134729/m.349057 type:complete len:416 (+) Transcript_134729:1103-2350(+)